VPLFVSDQTGLGFRLFKWPVSHQQTIVIAIFTFLPMAVASLAPVAWAGFLAPKITRYIRQFQNVQEHEAPHTESR
jgi:hypothetical protein